MKMRIQTVAYYEVLPEQLQSEYSTDDFVEAAQTDQKTFRDDPVALLEFLDTRAGLSEGLEVYVQPFDPGGMMFTDEFVREVIQIVRLEDLEIHINHYTRDRGQSVAVKLSGSNDGVMHSLFGYGSTVGYALRDIREQLRNLTGK